MNDHDKMIQMLVNQMDQLVDHLQMYHLLMMKD